MKGKKLAWLGVAALVLLAAACRAAPAASAAFLLAGAALCPLEKWQGLLRQRLQWAGLLKGAVIVVLIVLGAVLTQTTKSAQTADIPPEISSTAAPVQEQPEPSPEPEASESPEPEEPEVTEAVVPQDEPEVPPSPEPSTDAEPEPSQTDAAEPEAEEDAQPSAEPETVTADYVLNTNSKKFHKPSCSGVKRMKEENKSSFTGTRDEVIAKGYTPCGTCKP